MINVRSSRVTIASPRRLADGLEARATQSTVALLSNISQPAPLKVARVNGEETSATEASRTDGEPPTQVGSVWTKTQLSIEGERGLG